MSDIEPFSLEPQEPFDLSKAVLTREMIDYACQKADEHREYQRKIQDPAYLEAQRIINRFFFACNDIMNFDTLFDISQTKKYSLICVDEILEAIENIEKLRSDIQLDRNPSIKYWQQVKKYIEEYED